MASSAPSSSSFPRGQDAPFPYDPPYPQQLDLMDVLLESLERARRCCRQRDEDGDEDDDGGSPPTSQNRDRKNHHHRAKILMLESPTGTGKSLSLAAASLAWLRHVEELDLHLPPSSSDDPSSPHAVAATTPPAPASRRGGGEGVFHQGGGGGASSSSWLSTWVSPDDRATAAAADSAQRRAQQTRQALRRELSRIRAQIVVPPQAGGGYHTNDNDNDRRRLFQRRLDVARHAVELARKQPPHRKHHWGRKRPKKVSLDTSFTKATSDDEFCLEDYRSDDADHDDDDDDIGPDHYHRPRDNMPSETASHSTSSSSSSSSSSTTFSARQLLDGSYLDGSSSQHNSNGKNGEHQPTKKQGSGVRKIVYAARTHSQLSQFVREVKRIDPTVRLVHLGGRQVLCGNPHVNNNKRHASEKAISEACLDLQKGKNNNKAGVVGTRTKKRTTTIQQQQLEGHIDEEGNGGRGCPLLAGRETALPTLALHLQTGPTDIEEAAALGRATHACAYYASRTAVASAEMVVLPYALLLADATTRHQTLGLSLDGALVLVDEAHNLPEAIRNLHSHWLSLSVLRAAAAQLTAYATKYSQRLAGRNLFYLGQLQKIVLALIKQLSSLQSSCFKSSQPQDGGGGHDDVSSSSLLMTSTELLIRCRLDNINLFQILRYLERSRLAQKLLGFMNYHHHQQQLHHGIDDPLPPPNHDNDEEPLSKHVSPMAVVETFLEKLSLSGTDGKVVVEKGNSRDGNGPATSGAAATLSSGPGYRYVLLNPATCMVDLVREAHAIALVGGTLRPFLHVAAELFVNNDNHDDPDLLAAAKRADECLKPSLLTRRLPGTATPPSSFSSITDRLTVFSCGHVVPPSNVLLQLWSHGPTGRTLDLRHQSRSTDTMLDEVGRCVIEICRVCPAGVVIFFPSYSYEHLVFARLQRSGLLQQLELLKPLHREPAKSNQVEASLRRYASDAVRRKGAVLFSVIGGKLSEGINFKDSMARCVAVVGLPYPDITDPVLKEKMSLLDSTSAISGRDYYQNLCMRAVNQSVGRAIRHANDFAAIVLLDQRYNTNIDIKEGLPHWLTNGSPPQTRGDFRQHVSDMARFFEHKQPAPNDTV